MKTARCSGVLNKFFNIAVNHPDAKKSARYRRVLVSTELVNATQGIEICENEEWRSEEFYFGHSLMLLPQPCLAPHHPCLVPHHPMFGTKLHLVSNSLSGTPPSLSGTISSPCLEPYLYLVSHPMSGTLPLTRTVSLSGIPSPVWYPIISAPPLLSCPSALPHLVLAAPIWPLTAPYSPPDLAPDGSILELVPPVPSFLLLPSVPFLAIWPSWPHYSIWLSAFLLLPYHPLLFGPIPDPIPTPSNIITKGPSTQKRNLSFSEFPSFLIFISISSHVGSISPHMVPSTWK